MYGNIALWRLKQALRRDEEYLNALEHQPGMKLDIVDEIATNLQQSGLLDDEALAYLFEDEPQERRQQEESLQLMLVDWDRFLADTADGPSLWN